MKILLHTVVVSTVVICALGWKNEWDGRLSFSCPSGQHISWVQSIHNNKKEDRRWDYGKVDWVGTRNCFWTRHINNFDQEYFQHHCGWNRVVVGFESEHIDRFEDRRWKLRCCPIYRRREYDCAWTEYANSYDKQLYYFVPEGTGIKGVRSTYTDYNEDGRWSFLVCRYDQDKACNGLKSVCGKTFDKVSFPGTHNSASGAYNRIKDCATRNQDQSIKEQATQGARFFDIDTRMFRNKVDTCHGVAHEVEVKQVLDDMASFLNTNFNNREIVVVRMADTWNTNVDRLVEYLRAAFPGNGSHTGINDYYTRNQRWPTIEQAIQENKRVFITAQDGLCDANCRRTYSFFISENIMVGDTGSEGGLTTKCDGITDRNRNRCQELRSKTFVLLSHFASRGLCLWDLAAKCNPFVVSAFRACLEKRTVVNFIAVDYFHKIGRYVVEAANYGNGGSSPSDPPGAPSTAKLIRNWFQA